MSKIQKTKKTVPSPDQKFSVIKIWHGRVHSNVNKNNTTFLFYSKLWTKEIKNVAEIKTNLLFLKPKRLSLSGGCSCSVLTIRSSADPLGLNSKAEWIWTKAQHKEKTQTYSKQEERNTSPAHGFISKRLQENKYTYRNTDLSTNFI